VSSNFESLKITTTLDISNEFSLSPKNRNLYLIRVRFLILGRPIEIHNVGV